MSRPLNPLLPLAIVAALTAAPFAWGEDLGTVGPTYAIEESHLLTAIEQMLRHKEQSGDLARLEAEAKQRIVNSIEHPKPLPGITRTEAARWFFFDRGVGVGGN